MISPEYLRILHGHGIVFTNMLLNYYPRIGGIYRTRMTEEELENYMGEPEYLGIPDIVDLLLLLPKFIEDGGNRKYLKIEMKNGVEVSYDGLFMCKSHTMTDTDNMVALMIVKSKLGFWKNE